MDIFEPLPKADLSDFPSSLFKLEAENVPSFLSFLQTRGYDIKKDFSNATWEVLALTSEYLTYQTVANNYISYQRQQAAMEAAKNSANQDGTEHTNSPQHILSRVKAMSPEDLSITKMALLAQVELIENEAASRLTPEAKAELDDLVKNSTV